MAYASSATEYLRKDGAANYAVDDFFQFLNMEGKKRDMKSFDFRQGCCAIGEHPTRNMEGPVFIKT